MENKKEELHLHVPIFQLHKISHRVRMLIAFVLGPLFNWSPTKIREGLKQRGVRLLPSLKAICLFDKRYRASHSLSDQPRSGRPSKLEFSHGEALDHWIRCDREITVAELQQRMLDVFRLQVSRECIRLHVRKLGWHKKQTRYCQMVREVNRVKRLTYCLMCYTNNEEFRDCIFSDEASIEVMRSGKMRFIHKEEKTIVAKVSKPKHPFKLSEKKNCEKENRCMFGLEFHTTKIRIFTGVMDSNGYQKILEEILVPFIKKVYPEGHRFIQDNDPKHTSRSTKEFMKTHGINHWRTPPESPDLNPIEMVWSMLKSNLVKKHKPQTKEQLVDGIADCWSSITPALQKVHRSFKESHTSCNRA